MRFVIEKSGIIFREWRFKIVADNHKILAHSEGYKNKADAESAVWLIKQDSGSAPIIEKGSEA